jgi:hypothetical protein
MFKNILFLFVLLAICQTTSLAQQPTPPPTPVSGPSMQAPDAQKADSILVTIILKHQQDKNLPEIRRILEAQGFWEMFPPADCRVVSWTFAVSLGHVITMQVPTGAVRRLNLAIENGAWGAYSSEVYISYDYKEIWEDYIEKREEAKAERN